MRTLLILLMILNLSPCAGTLSTYIDRPDVLNQLVEELDQELEAVEEYYYHQKTNQLLRMEQLSVQLQTSTSVETQMAIMIEQQKITCQLRAIKETETSEISKIRYLKGLQIIKILYEKTLSLDHHFSSVSTFHEISQLSNPNQYPEFIKLKEELSVSSSKKSGFQLTNLLGENIYTSVIHSLVTLFNKSNIDKKDKEAQLAEVECILDFTLRMHNDLNTIYFETAFLTKSNDKVMEELKQLFTDYTKPIGYNSTLDDCRSKDDWEMVKNHLDRYLERWEELRSDKTQRFKAHKMLVNLEFPIDRLLQFIIIYNAHIDQGAKFYEKFSIMLNSYENEKHCASQIPIEYEKIKNNIGVSIDKFNNAYKPVEINGSKMKQILYGINEYD